MTTTTQGEHAQTEALRLANSITWMDTFTDYQREELDKAAAELRRLHAQVAALTAAPAHTVDGEFRQFTTPDDGLNTLLNETFNMARGPKHNNMDTAMAWDESLQAVLARLATVQPAAPQGVDYAELPDEHAAFETWARLRSDWRPNLERKGDGYVGAFADEAWRGWSARASNGQAPAGDEQKALAALRYYKTECSGAEPSISVFHRMVDEALEAQAAPAAGAVAVPRETLVAWRQWCAQSMSHAIEHEISDWLAAAPTPAAQADSVLEDAARLAKITQAIRDYHFALDNREHGGVAMARAWNAICDVLNMDWVQGAESAARKQGGA